MFRDTKADFRLEWPVSIYLDNLGQRCTTWSDTTLCNQSNFLMRSEKQKRIILWVTTPFANIVYSEWEAPA